MVTRRMKQNAMLVGIIILTLSVMPVYADEMATIMGSHMDNTTLDSIIGKASSLLKPAMDENRITITAANNTVIYGDTNNVEERLVNLLSNAITHAQQGTEIKASYDTKTNEIVLWVTNSKIAYDVKRTVVDSMGNTFKIETKNGKGTSYAISL